MGVSKPQQPFSLSRPFVRGMVATDWGRDPKPIREYVAMADADGYRPATIDNGRSLLLEVLQVPAEEVWQDSQFRGMEGVRCLQATPADNAHQEDHYSEP